MILGLILLFGMVMGLFMVAYEDNVPFALSKKLRCLIGWHKFRVKFGKLKIHKYYCKWCRKPRKHPPLKIIDGGNKIGYDRYKY
jgi:hypothetical protein